MTLQHTTVYDPAHLFELDGPLLLIVDRVGLAGGQHEARRWEYAQALTAASDWLARRRTTHRLTAVDVGGAGSGLALMLGELGIATIVVDPACPGSTSVEELRRRQPDFSADMVFSISVLEHVPDLDGHLIALAELVAPGGLLFLTADYCFDTDEHPRDVYHFHWMRERIFNLPRWAKLTSFFEARGFRVFGGIDLEQRGRELAFGHWGYTTASLAMVREG